MTVDGAAFDRPQIGPRFVPGLDRRDARQVRGLYEREHWFPVTSSGGLATADDAKQLRDEIATALTNPSARSDGRIKLLDSLLTVNDGRAAERLVGEILLFLRSPEGSPETATSEAQSGVDY